MVSAPMELEPLPYRTGSMWVFASGCTDEVMATPWVKSTLGAPCALR